MTKASKSKELKDEPGAEERFMSGVRKALEMPHKPHKARTETGKKKVQKRK